MALLHPTYFSARAKGLLSLRHETDAADATTRCLTRHLDAPVLLFDI
jgi:hypothetical protein